MKSKKILEVDLLHGNPLTVLVMFALPLIGANIFQLLYTTVDTMVVGKYVSTQALASVGATTPVVDLLLGLTIGLANGLSIVIAQKKGTHDTAKIHKAIINGFYLMLCVVCFVTLCGLCFHRDLFHMIHVDESLMDGASTYVSILFAGALFTAMYNYEAAILRAYGNSIVPLLLLILSALLNVVFDLAFVLIFHLGISGVALATILAQLICCSVCFMYMMKYTNILAFEKEEFHFEKSVILEQLRISIPLAFFQSLLAISFLVVQSALNTFGSLEVAAYTAAYKMDSCMMQLLSGFGTAISTYAAQNYGNQSYERIQNGAKSLLKVTITLSFIVMVIAQLFSKQFMLLFVNANEVEVIALGQQYISFTSLCYWILGINFVVRFVLTGIGQSFIPFIVGILEVVIRGIGTYCLVYPYGFDGMVYLNPLCWFTSTALILCLYPYLLRRAKHIQKRSFSF